MPSTAESWEEAQKKLKTDFPDNVLLDIDLPGTNGIEILKILKKEYPLLPVLMISGSAHKEDVLESVKLGADGYLTKPVTRDELLKKVSQFIGTDVGESDEEGVETDETGSGKFDVRVVEAAEEIKPKKPQPATQTQKAPEPPKPETAVDYIAQLEKLAGLKEKGFISEAEFEKSKQKIFDLMDRL